MSWSKEELKSLMRDVLKEQKNTEESYVHVQHCPDCYQKAIVGLNSISKFACKDCGLPLGNEEFAQKIEECPNCGSKNAKEVSRNDE